MMLQRENQIQQNLEFYMSDGNLRQDQYLRALMESESCVSWLHAKCFASFPLMGRLGATDAEITQAANTSEVLEGDMSLMMIRRRLPLPPSDSSLDRKTVYVEGIPKHHPKVDHQLIGELFSTFGVLERVRLPRHKKSGGFK
eukprot:GHVN01054580.1.p1 GENE.GHVN01054580.1~~GHVN01054580.1.p1  ORF type:complete len:142 (+),score=9.47 GHVN01054580.1:102-527(+)